MKRIFAILAAAVLVILPLFALHKIVLGTIITLVAFAALNWEIRRFLKTDLEEDRIASPFEPDKT